jgi:hypothetical protein
MKRADFVRIVKVGESQHVDRKIEGHAFDSKHVDSERAKAELAKDICAMANNGIRASYLLIGVSDKGGFKPVSNANLTNDNFQTFCKDAITPPPKVRLHEFLRKNSSGTMERFLALQIGPNPRHAYRLNRDFIDLKNSDEKKRYCFRRNEVWIRREATSDLATPEEIVRLMRGDRASEVEDSSTGVVDFSRLERGEQLPTMLMEAERFFTEMGYLIKNSQSKDPTSGFQVVIPSDRKRVVFRCVAYHSLTLDVPMTDAIRQAWTYDHGMFIILMEHISKRGFPGWSTLKLKENWGFFSEVSEPDYRFGVLARKTPDDRYITGKDFFSLNFPEANLSILTLVRCSSVRVRPNPSGAPRPNRRSGGA